MLKLEQMLKYVSEHNDFYKKRIKEYGITNPLDITQWPVLSRKELQENRYNMFSDGGKSDYLHQNLRRQTSSGSSGTPVTVYWNNLDYYASNLCLWRKRMQYYGISPLDKFVNFTLNSFNARDNKQILYRQYSSNELSINVSLIQEFKQYIDILNLLEAYQPKWLYVQPFVLEKLYVAYQKLGAKPPVSIMYIESVGEILTRAFQQKASDFFGVPVANMYGSEEMNGIAYECPYHQMHVISDNVYLEVSSSYSNTGSAIITNLKNKTMPLIRYAQNDDILFNNLSRPCKCGSMDPVISIIKGRASESIKINEDLELNSLLLMEMIAEVNNQYADIIINYSFEYSKKGKKLTCYIALQSIRANWFDSVKSSIFQIYNTKTNNNIDITFDIVRYIPNCNANVKHRNFKIVD